MFVAMTKASRKLRVATGHGRCLITAALTFALVAVMCLPAMAASPSAFSVRAIIPENQIDNRLTYFDLMVSPGDKQVLQLAITNSEEQEVEAQVAVAPASTAQNGLIIYTDPDARDESMDLAVTEFTTVLTPMLRIPAGGTAVAEIRLDLPQQPFEGVVLGGVSVTADYAQKQPEDPQQEGFQIENRYAYVIGLKLRESLEDAEGAPEFHLKDIRPGLVNYRQALLVNLQQSEPFIANHLEVFAQVTKRGDSAFIRQLELSNAQMAPNSNGDFVIDWSAPIDPGTYYLIMRVEREGRTWEWEEEFVISSEDAVQMNEDSVVEYTSTQSALTMFMMVLLAALLLIVILLLLLILRKREKDTESTHQ